MKIIMSLKNKSINLADSFNKKDERVLKRQKTLLFISPAVLLVIILAGVYTSILIKTNGVKNDKQTLKDDLSILNNQQQEAIEIEKNNRILFNDAEKMKLANEEKDIYNTKNNYFERELFSNIKKCGNSKIKISGCTFSGGMMSMTLTSSGNDPSNISDFVRELKKLEYFSSVDYTGYTGGEEYTFTVVCIFK